MNQEALSPCIQEQTTGMAHALLPEIAESLARLARSGEPGSIDLRSLPLSDGDRSALAQRLGRGEVVAHLEVAGSTEIWETSYPGVWWVRHLGMDGKVACEQIEICPIPEILITHSTDIQAAAARLRDDLDFGKQNTDKEVAAHV
jgi:hydrogenase-1 operon protein HyaF